MENKEGTQEKNIDRILKRLEACQKARDWAAGKSIEEAWATCERGDWMLWFAANVGVEGRLLTAAKAECAALALPIMRDQRSIAAVKAAMSYSLGEIGDEELDAYKSAAYSAAEAARTTASSAAYIAAYAAYHAASASAFSAFSASSAASAAAEAAAYHASSASAEKMRILKECAIIVRRIIPIEIIQKNILTYT